MNSKKNNINKKTLKKNMILYVYIVIMSCLIGLHGFHGILKGLGQ